MRRLGRAGANVVSRAVTFPVANLNRTLSVCLPDGRDVHRAGPGSVGPGKRWRCSAPTPTGSTCWSTSWRDRRLVLEPAPGTRPTTTLARSRGQGETSLVIDRLGYDREPAAATAPPPVSARTPRCCTRSSSTCARAPVRGRDPDNGTTPAAQHVVVHGHGLGASIAQVEEAHYRDVEGLVLMSWTDTGHSPLAVDLASRQSATCLQGAGYARFAPTAATFRNGMFATAPSGVQRSGGARERRPLRRRALAGDESGGLAARCRAGDSPVLLLYGGKDAYTRDGAPARRPRRTSRRSRSPHT